MPGVTGWLELLATILPRALLGALSPVIFVNASTFVLTGRLRSALGFLAGTAAVLLPLGVVSAGILGASAASELQRELTSRVVDVALGILLLGYAVVLVRGAERSTTAASAPQRSAVPFGMISMATNFTTLPLYLSATQHIGAARPPLWAIALLLVLVTAVTLLPAWLPIVLAWLAPGLLRSLTERGSSGPGTSSTAGHPRWSIGSMIPIVACLLGGAYLILHSLIPGFDVS